MNPHPILGVRRPGEESGDVEGAVEELDITHAQRAGVAVLLADAAPPDTLLGRSVCPQAWAEVAFGSAEGCVQQSGGTGGNGALPPAQEGGRRPGPVRLSRGVHPPLCPWPRSPSVMALPTPGSPSACPRHGTAPGLLLLPAPHCCCFSLCCGWEASLGKGEDRQGKAAVTNFGDKMQKEQGTMGDAGFRQESHEHLTSQ